MSDQTSVVAWANAMRAVEQAKEELAAAQRRVDSLYDETKAFVAEHGPTLVELEDGSTTTVRDVGFLVRDEDIAAAMKDR